jgi:hypothetical protein
MFPLRIRLGSTSQTAGAMPTLQISFVVETEGEKA